MDSSRTLIDNSQRMGEVTCIGRHARNDKNKFDKTNPPVEGSRPKTTTGGINSSFSCNSTDQNLAPREARPLRARAILVGKYVRAMRK